MIRLLVLGLVFILWSLTIAAPTDNTQKGFVFPKKIKTDTPGKTEEHKMNSKDHTTVSHDKISSTGSTTESSINSTYVTFTIGEEYGVSPKQEHDSSMVSHLSEEPEEQEQDEPEEPQEPAHSSEPIPDAVPLPDDATDGMIEYNLGNPLALKLHLPWWPLKDMLKSIQDAISVMNLTMDADSLDDDYTKTKIVQFDDRNYTLKVKVFKPHENNRLLVRLISLTPVIDDPTDKDDKIEDELERKNEALEESLEKSFEMRKMDIKKDDDDDDDDDDSDDHIKHFAKKEEKTKAKDSKKEKPNKKKKEGKKEEEKKEEGKKGGDAEKKSK